MCCQQLLFNGVKVDYNNKPQHSDGRKHSLLSLGLLSSELLPLEQLAQQGNICIIKAIICHLTPQWWSVFKLSVPFLYVSLNTRPSELWDIFPESIHWRWWSLSGHQRQQATVKQTKLLKYDSLLNGGETQQGKQDKPQTICCTLLLSRNNLPNGSTSHNDVGEGAEFGLEGDGQRPVWRLHRITRPEEGSNTYENLCLWIWKRTWWLSVSGRGIRGGRGVLLSRYVGIFKRT